MPNSSSGQSWNPHNLTNRLANVVPNLRGVVQQALPQPVAQLIPGGAAVAEGRAWNVQTSMENRPPIEQRWFRKKYGKMGLMRVGVQCLLWSIVITVLLAILPRLAPVLLSMLIPVVLIFLVVAMMGSFGGGSMGLGCMSGIFRVLFGLIGSVFRLIGHGISGVADGLVKSVEAWMHHMERQYARPVTVTTFYIDLHPNAPSTASWGRMCIDARIRGDMLGGSIRNNDHVCLEGREENGVLHVKAGKNLSTGATIQIQRPWEI